MKSTPKNILFHIKLSLAFLALLTILLSNYTSYEVSAKQHTTNQSDTEESDTTETINFQILSVDAVFSILKVDFSKTLYAIFNVEFRIVESIYFTYETQLPRIPAILNTFERIIAINAP